MAKKTVVDATTKCWLWTDKLTREGYARVSFSGKLVHAHRLVFEAVAGAIEPGLHLDHLCRVTGCVNPTHLEPVTPRENTMRGIGPSAVNAKKTICKRGHVLCGKNVEVQRDGHRHCVACKRVLAEAYSLIVDKTKQRDATRRYRARKKAALALAAEISI